MSFTEERLNESQKVTYSKLDPERKKEYAKAWEQLEMLSGPTVYGYARVSSKGQAADGNGLDVQYDDLKAAGAEEIYEDVYTGTTMERPELTKLLRRIQSGDTLIVAKLDRLARTATDGANLIKDLLERGVTVKVLNMGTIDDSPVGKLSMQMLLAFAEFERDMIVERMNAGKEKAKQKPGYHEGRKKVYTPEQEKHAMELLEEGNSYKQVAAMTGISTATLSRIKKNMSLI